MVLYNNSNYASQAHLTHLYVVTPLEIMNRKRTQITSANLKCVFSQHML